MDDLRPRYVLSSRKGHLRTAQLGHATIFYSCCGECTCPPIACLCNTQLLYSCFAFGIDRRAHNRGWLKSSEITSTQANHKNEPRARSPPISLTGCIHDAVRSTLVHHGLHSIPTHDSYPIYTSTLGSKRVPETGH